MAIFARRTLQKLLNENRSFLPDKQVDEHAAKLNRQDDASIGTEWEVAILNALSKIGEVKHEKKFNDKKPDIFFVSSHTPSFLADIVTVSDENYEKSNPRIYFHECLNQFFSKKGVSLAGLSIKMDGNLIGKYGNSKMILALPKKHEMHSFIKENFFIIRKKIIETPSEEFTTDIRSGGGPLSVSYNPNSIYSSTSYAAYTALYSLTNNPIYNCLKDKAVQLKNSGYNGVMGVFLCDGGCDSLNNRHYNPHTISQDKIIRKIFKNNSSLSFIVVVTPEETQTTSLVPRGEKYISFSYYLNPQARHPVSQSFLEEIKNIEKQFPQPESMPVNAKNRFKSIRNKGLSFYLGYTMKPNEIKISSRMLTELLAGELAFEKFDADAKAFYRNNRNEIKEFFNKNLQQGRMIENIYIEKGVDKDDDWIIFRYGSLDAAISEYK